MKHFEHELDLRKNLADKLGERPQITTYSSSPNNDKQMGQKVALVSDQDLKQIKENLIKTADLSTTSLGQHENRYFLQFFYKLKNQILESVRAKQEPFRLKSKLITTTKMANQVQAGEICIMRPTKLNH